jgi:hypothetical protein
MNSSWRQALILVNCRAEREEEERHARALQAQIERAAELGTEAEEAVNNVGVLERQVCRRSEPGFGFMAPHAAAFTFSIRLAAAVRFLLLSACRNHVCH